MYHGQPLFFSVRSTTNADFFSWKCNRAKSLGFLIAKFRTCVFFHLNHWHSSAGFNREPKTERTLNSFYYHILFVAKFGSIILWARNLKTYPKKMQTLLLKHCPTCRNWWKAAPKTKTYEKMWQLFSQKKVVLMKIWRFFFLQNKTGNFDRMILLNCLVHQNFAKKHHTENHH